MSLHDSISKLKMAHGFIVEESSFLREYSPATQDFTEPPGQGFLRALFCIVPYDLALSIAPKIALAPQDDIYHCNKTAITTRREILGESEEVLAALSQAITVVKVDETTSNEPTKASKKTKSPATGEGSSAVS